MEYFQFFFPPSDAILSRILPPPPQEFFSENEPVNGNKREQRLISSIFFSLLPCHGLIYIIFPLPTFLITWAVFLSIHWSKEYSQGKRSGIFPLLFVVEKSSGLSPIGAGGGGERKDGFNAKFGAQAETDIYERRRMILIFHDSHLSRTKAQTENNNNKNPLRGIFFPPASHTMGLIYE